MKRCRACGAAWEGRTQPGLREECAACGTPLHACVQCRFYDADATSWCREPRARDRRPRDPGTPNRCDWFQLADAEPAADADASRRARDAARALFGASDADEEADGAAEAPPAWMQAPEPQRRDPFANPPEEGDAGTQGSGDET
jgi:hypothetical protein